MFSESLSPLVGASLGSCPQHPAHVRWHCHHELLHLAAHGDNWQVVAVVLKDFKVPATLVAFAVLRTAPVPLAAVSQLVGVDDADCCSYLCVFASRCLCSL